MGTKGTQIIGLEKALASVPEADRDQLEAKIREAFANFDPKNPPGETLDVLPAGTTTCPKCREALDLVCAAADGHDCIYNCDRCDTSFAVPPR